jgi:two-component system nitrogen regulation sensor histidine kinase GlnL
MLVARQRRKKLHGAEPGVRGGPDSLENVLACLADAVVLTDEHDGITMFNPAAEQLTGFAEAQVLHRPCADVFAATPVVADMVRRTRTLAQNQSCGEETLFARPRPLPVRLSCSPIWGPEGQIQGTALVIQDLSYQKKLEDESRRNETLARLGGLVAGLAHEVKNPLGGISGAAQLLAKRFADQPEAVECTGVMIREIDRLSRLVEQLLTLGAPPTPTLVPVDIHMVLGEVLALMETEMHARDIAVRRRFLPGLPDVCGEETQLKSVFLNLLKNAIEAMPEGGTLTITTAMETDFYIIRRRRGRAATAPPLAGGEETPLAPQPLERFLRVEVADTGPGFGPVDPERIFEPFFTTKPRGSGLGLAICERIVAVHGGDIHAENRRGGGAVVTVTLPVVHA